MTKIEISKILEELEKTNVFAARNHLGKELVDCEKEKIIKKILFAEDFEYRLNKKRF